MTAHPKRDYATLNQTQNYFDHCYRTYAELFNITDEAGLYQLRAYLILEWRKALSYGIEDKDICKFIYARRTGRSQQAARRPIFRTPIFRF